jgi:hypothetical protein
MAPSVRRWLVAAAVVAAGWAAPAAPAQSVVLPPIGAAGAADERKPDRAEPAPLPSALPAPEPERPPAYVLPPPGPIVVPDLPRPDPMLDRPEAAQPGLYVDVETQLLSVSLRNQPIISVPAPGTNAPLTDLVRFPTNHLDDAVSPRLDLGWRLEDGWGGLELGYRTLATRGSDDFALGQSPATVSGKLAVDQVDFRYVSQEFSLDPHWEMRWGVGARLLILYFDSRLSIRPAAPSPGDTLAEAETNHLRSYGAFGNLEVARRLGVPGLTAFGFLEFTDTYGRLKQTGAEVLAGAAGPQGSAVRNDSGVGVPLFNGRAGLSYEPPGCNHSRFLIGYQYETMFQVGRLGLSRGQLDDQGLFLRAEINF